MYERERDGRREAVVTDIEALVPENHLVRKIEKVMDYEWIYKRVAPYYSTARNVRPGTDPVVLVKMVLLQHLFGLPSLRQTHRECEVNVAYRWFLGYGLLDKIPHFATVSYAFCRRFPEELAAEIFEHILNKALNNYMVDSSMVFIDGTHIKTVYIGEEPNPQIYFSQTGTFGGVVFIGNTIVALYNSVKDECSYLMVFDRELSPLKRYRLPINGNILTGNPEEGVVTVLSYDDEKMYCYDLSEWL